MTTVTCIGLTHKTRPALHYIHYLTDYKNKGAGGQYANLGEYSGT